MSLCARTRTLVERYATSAFPLKADIRSPFDHVRLLPIADIVPLYPSDDFKTAARSLCK
jgi:hypothetical protein